MIFINVCIFICYFGVTTALNPSFNESCPILKPISCYWCLYGNVIKDNCPICECDNTNEKEEIAFGSMILTKDQAKLLVDREFVNGFVQPRAGTSDVILKWDNLRQPDGHYHIPYYFETNPPLSERSKDVIHRAISAIHSQTCIRFEPAKVGQKCLIRFANSSDCSYFVGRKKGVNTIRGCTYSVGEALKAIVHALGFFPESNRPDRDNYIVLFPEHMSQNGYKQIMKIRPDLWRSYNISYDIYSITHFGPYQFSAFGGVTVMDKATGKPVKPNRWALSSGDLRQIRAMYNCSGVRGTQKASNCYNRIDYGLKYRGKLNVTESGFACQRWDVQTPHAHTMDPSVLIPSKLVMNYCRNPNVRDRPWCYTTNSSVKWEYCNITVCNESHPVIPVPTPLESKRGFWSVWGDYSACSTSCGYGFKYSVRNCVGDAPGSSACPGKYWRYLTCNATVACPGSDQWHQWSRWSECNTDCGNGTQTRVRFCIGTVGKGSCVGNAVENSSCATGRSCPLYSGGKCYNSSDPFGYRGTISVDSKGNTCFNWTNTKFNTSGYPNAGLEMNYCRNPDGRKNVPYCYIRKNKVKTCNVPSCNLDAIWGKWGDWSACSSSCSDGLKTRIRRCRNGHFGEGSCTGDVFMTELCNMTCKNGSSFVVDILKAPKTNAPMSTTTPSIVECLDYSNPRSYRGTRRWSKSGKLCQYWDAAYPWPHNYTDSTLIAQAGLLENFCRTPNPEDQKPWCFLKEFYPMKEECDIPHCPYSTDLHSYFQRLWITFLETFKLNPNFGFGK